MTDRLVLSVSEAAEALGVSDDLVYELTERGELPCLRFGRRKLIPRQAIELVVELAIADFDPGALLASLNRTPHRMTTDRKPAADPTPAGNGSRARLLPHGDDATAATVPRSVPGRHQATEQVGGHTITGLLEVGVDGEGGAPSSGVAEPPGNGAQVHARSEKRGCHEMPEVVEADVVEADVVTETVELQAHEARSPRNRPVGLVGEHEGGRRQGYAACEGGLRHPGPLPLEEGDGAGVEGEAADRAAGLGPGALDRPVFAHGDGAGDGEGAEVKVEVGPPQRQEFAPACSCDGGEDEEQGEGGVVALRLFEEGEHGVGRRGVDLALGPRTG